MAKNKSDHDVLIEIKTLLLEMKKGFDNHLEHHRRHEIAMLTATIGAIFTALIATGTAIIAIIR